MDKKEIKILIRDTGTEILGFYGDRNLEDIRVCYGDEREVRVQLSTVLPINVYDAEQICRLYLQVIQLALEKRREKDIKFIQNNI